MDRITGAQLDELALAAITKATEPETANVSGQLFLQVINEVRRLRGLIERACLPELSNAGADHHRRKMLLMLEAEALAIRTEERATKGKP